MEQKLAELHSILQKHMGLHRQLLDCVRLEREALVSTNVDTISEITSSKEALVAAIQQQEHYRQKLMQQFAADQLPLTLRELLVHVQVTHPKQSEQLRSTFQALSLLVQRISEQNTHNRLLVERSLDHVSRMKVNILGAAQSRTSVYTQSGKKNVTAQEPRLYVGEA